MVCDLFYAPPSISNQGQVSKKEGGRGEQHVTGQVTVVCPEIDFRSAASAIPPSASDPLVSIVTYLYACV